MFRMQITLFRDVQIYESNYKASQVRRPAIRFINKPMFERGSGTAIHIVAYSLEQ